MRCVWLAKLRGMDYSSRIQGVFSTQRAEVAMKYLWVYCRLVLSICSAAPVAAAGATLTGGPIVGVGPAYENALRTTYGEPENPVLRQIIGERVSAALHDRNCGGASQLEITLLDARPTHPTDKQVEDDAAIDRLRTHYLGGASFTARLMDADGKELKSLNYEWYAENDQLGSKAAEPWGDVRLASEGLGAELAGACAKLSRQVSRSP